ncbi:hypothetical protein GJ496_007497 [Pomphorhynchus laevis]|nr:hypothetical protein GJ496_007497 [Pomphorhynchus laevis]
MVTFDGLFSMDRSGMLLTFPKKGAIRPIAVGFTIRRIADKLVRSFATKPCPAKLLPVQYGVGFTSGLEAPVHAARALAHGSFKYGSALVKHDFSNAFTALSCDPMFAAVERYVREIAIFVRTSL